MTLSSSTDPLHHSVQRLSTAELHALRANACLGLFDSGLGGLTVLRRLLSRRPGQPCLYVGDTARVPYGSRSRNEIRTIASEAVSWLRSQGAEAIVMACNTTNALALDVAQAEAGVPVLGLIDAVARQVAWDRVGVLATPATAASGAYGQAFANHRSGVKVVEMGCPEFVPAVERHELDSPSLRESARTYLAPLLEARVEAIVMGCSHYPLLEPLLKDLVPPDVLLIDPAEALVSLVLSMLPADQRPLSLKPDLSGCRLVATSDPEAFAQGAGRWLGCEPEVELISLQSEGQGL